MVSVAALLGAVALLVGRSLWRQHQQDIARKTLEFLPGVSQHIRDFHRVKMRDGKKVWEISAQDAQYFQEDNLVVVRNATMELYLRDGRVVGLKGDEARIILDAKEIDRVELSGAIQVTASEYVIRTERATYEQGRNLISAPGVVEISGRGLQLRGDRMEVQVATERVSLLDNVSMQVQPQAFKQGERHGSL